MMKTFGHQSSSKKICVLACAVHTAPLNNTWTNISSRARRYH